MGGLQDRHNGKELIARDTLRRKNNLQETSFRQLHAAEVEVLVRNNNTSDNWNNFLVTDEFDPLLVRNCSFYGLIRIGKLEHVSLAFHDLTLPAGLYHSTVTDCDFGENPCIHNVHYLSRYVISDEVMIANVNELSATQKARFGNGILRKGEQESTRIWLELRNENGGRKVMPFDGMMPQDAWLWSTHRDNRGLMKAFAGFTAALDQKDIIPYGFIGSRSVIKNCMIIKDVWIGSDAYLKGATKIKNVTIHSSAQAPSQIGEGCELVNGIIGEGCRVFYGVKAVRFILASHSQLKYGARLINSYLGNNSTISCCEVLNSLIFPFHEQHHNNSFLVAATLMGQSNIAAGATLGSNHNSRHADGEMIAGRGFWPGLCVSIKHNSRFASFTLLAKSDFPYELDIPFPFSLVINDTSANELRVLPAYWFLYNQYALRRNESKFSQRDLRTDRSIRFEYRCLAPDTVNEMFRAVALLEELAGKAASGPGRHSSASLRKAGVQWFRSGETTGSDIDLPTTGLENSRRKTVILKVRSAYSAYRKMIRWYALDILSRAIFEQSPKSVLQLFAGPRKVREEWVNVGGQLMPAVGSAQLVSSITSGKISGWTSVHDHYRMQSEQYDQQVLEHAVASLQELEDGAIITPVKLSELLQELPHIEQEIQGQLLATRRKDHESPFRKMLYGNAKEMEAVMGSLKDNSFLNGQAASAKALIARVKHACKQLDGGR